ncbi:MULTISPECIES: hypothetical protein [Streptomyces]|uniref:hypothetical protein n=1 Tax=Streptomyces TaxID=1883 RepID=UPI0004C49C36|nr:MULTISPECIES: hypothetical protein [Streptomyces]
MHEITDDNGQRYRVGGKVSLEEELPTGIDLYGTIRRLYHDGTEWMAVVAWPHWDPLLRHRGIHVRNSHPLSDLRPE